MGIRKVGVVGAGAMGSSIAALVASAGIPVILLDLPSEGDPDALAKRGVERALKSRAFYDPEAVRLITVGNVHDHLHRLGDCDWVVEAVVEEVEPKRSLFAQLDSVLPPTVVVSSNTSTIPMRILVEGRSESFRRRFLGTHFFNPPRALLLLELVPGPDTDPELLRRMQRFAERVLGRRVIVAKDRPGFVANRIGIYGLVQAIRITEEEGLTLEEVDRLTGPFLGRPRSATYRTVDLTGLDILVLGTRSLQENTGDDYHLPDWVHHLYREGRLGDKAGSGFFRREGDTLLAWDYSTRTYRPQRPPEIPGLERAEAVPFPDRLRAAMELPDRYGRFVRKLLLRTWHFAFLRASEVAHDLVSVDRALEWGFGWELGPFRQMDAVGSSLVAQGFAELGLEVPDLLTRATQGFYANGAYLDFSGEYRPVPEREGVLSLRQTPTVLTQAPEARLADLGDGILGVELRGPSGALTPQALEVLRRAVEEAEVGRWEGIVIGTEDLRRLPADWDYRWMLDRIRGGEEESVQAWVEQVQEACIRLRECTVPVVICAAGQVAGPGVAFLLAADRVVAHADLQVALVEYALGLVPVGVPTFLLRRFTEDLLPYGVAGELKPEAGADLHEATHRVFRLLLSASTTRSAQEAQRLGLLCPCDLITLSRDRMLAQAKAVALALAPSYVPPVPGPLWGMGDETLGNLRYAAWARWEARQATEWDREVAYALADLLSGGEGPPRWAEEQEFLQVEVSTFLRLLRSPRTQERLVHYLETGRFLRN
ncbi:MAG: 3-hydroxyacyl-CoA dehydrogenase/enoyl-CoA hydratase family protein [Armatimonadetes bacterium]|nr:3-hydroxyacyl-CoA dehydrogenase/enoyl-CoA hydratase family protein [Armatimonadota bacterium]MDW8153124.1 3-hydroxyacyl-CoA dehydrogenase/enoyl-CoA hydratase family protein [Armatimonadota bacterium]